LDVGGTIQPDLGVSAFQHRPDLSSVDAWMLAQDQQTLAIHQTGHGDAAPAVILPGSPVPTIAQTLPQSPDGADRIAADPDHGKACVKTADPITEHEPPSSRPRPATCPATRLATTPCPAG